MNAALQTLLSSVGDHFFACYRAKSGNEDGFGLEI